jgi:TPR repeat protein
MQACRKLTKKRDYDEAFARLLPLAESGYAPAQVWIGGMFAKGLGVALDSVQAYVWLDLAARAGVGRATKWRAEIAERLSADELGEAQRRAADWIPKRPADQEAD